MDNLINKQELLFYYIHSGNAPALRALVAEGVHVGAVIDQGHAPLHEAVSVGKVDVLAVLIEGGLDVNVPDDAGHTPLLWAVLGDQLEMCRRLIDAGAVSARAPTWPINPKKYLSPFQQAVRLGKEDIAYLLFERFCEDPAQTTLQGVALEAMVQGNRAMQQMLRVMQTEHAVRSQLDAGQTHPSTKPTGLSPL